MRESEEEANSQEKGGSREGVFKRFERTSASGHRCRRKQRRGLAALHKQLEGHDDATLATHYQLWQEQSGEAVSQSTMSRAIRKLGWTRKKRRWGPLNATPRHALPGLKG